MATCKYVSKYTTSKGKGECCGRKIKSADAEYCWQHKAHVKKSTNNKVNEITEINELSEDDETKVKQQDFIQLVNSPSKPIPIKKPIARKEYKKSMPSFSSYSDSDETESSNDDWSDSSD